jgi:four helix bundle protein
MPSIHRFEDIEAWREARVLTKTIYELTRDGVFAKDFGLASQIQRASVSVMTNIVEGFDSGSNLEFRRFLGYARRSASEVQSHLYVALDQGYLKAEEFDGLYERAEKVRRMVTSLSRYLRSQIRGQRSTRERANALTG